MKSDPNDQPHQRRLVRFGIPTAVIIAVTALFTPVIDSAFALLGDDTQAQVERRLTAELELPPLETAAQQAAPSTTLEVSVEKGDTLAAIFTRTGLPPQALQELLRVNKFEKAFQRINAGQKIEIEIDQNYTLDAFVTHPDPLTTLTVRRQAGKLVLSTSRRDYETRTGFAEAVINTSLFEAGQAARLSNSLTMAMATIFGWDIDFALDIREGDTFSVLYEQYFVDGVKLRDGEILAAEFVNQGKVFRAVRHNNQQGRSEYFTPSGAPMRKTFLRTPVDFTRISSYFGKRVHPVLNTLRAHKGVDYAAEHGTPVRAAGDGAVEFRGTKGGYGNTVILKHQRSYTTLYGHMSRFAKGVQPGSRVKQGQTIGYVGSSGLATGPHLHYELRIDGIHRNPLSIKVAQHEPLGKSELSSFAARSTRILAQLDTYKRLNLTSSEF